MPKDLGFRCAVLIAALTALVLGSCTGYDELVDKDQVAAEKWANLEAQLQRRHDLVPQLVAVVKGSAKHEEETLREVTQARAEATSIKLSEEDLSDPEKVAAFEKAQSQLGSALGRLLVVQEAYPDLKANASFRDLQTQLEGTENRILRAREEYNAAARDYNATLSRIRGKVVNRVTGKTFQPRAYFSASADAYAAPSVSF